jgi:hypothetical protein
LHFVSELRLCALLLSLMFNAPSLIVERKER